MQTGGAEARAVSPRTAAANDHRAYVQANLESFLKDAMATLAKVRPADPVEWVAAAFADGEVPAVEGEPTRAADRPPFLEYIGTDTIGLLARAIAEVARETPEQPLERMGQLLREKAAAPAGSWTPSRSPALRPIALPAARATSPAAAPPASPHASQISELAEDMAGLLGAEGQAALEEARATTPRSRGRALSAAQQAAVLEQLQSEAAALLDSPRRRADAGELTQLGDDAAAMLCVPRPPLLATVARPIPDASVPSGNVALLLRSSSA